MANPQSWNLYSYVNGNPVNFNDPGGHYCKAAIPSPAYMVQESGPSWLNMGAYQSFYGNLYGGNVAFGGGGPGGGGSSQSSGYWANVTTYEEQTIDMWLKVNEEGYYTLYGQQYFIGTQYDWAVYPMTEQTVSSSLQWVSNAGGNQGTTMSAQPMQQTYMSSLPPYRMHWGRFFELNSRCTSNTLAITLAFAVGGGGIVGLSGGGHPYAIGAGAGVGALVGLGFAEFEYVMLSIYREGWPAPPEPGAPPPGLGQFNQQKFILPPPPTTPPPGQ